MESVTIIYFSPTGTTRKVVEAIARGVGAEKIEVLDLTKAGSRRCRRLSTDAGLAILGVPVYTGRVPYQAVEALQHMQAQGTPAVIAVVYGNRAYEDALLELSDIAGRIGFVPIAGAAFVGEHSFSTAATPIAAGRPDDEDLEKATAFGRLVRERFDTVEPAEGRPLLRVPGNSPYRERAQHLASLETLTSLCSRCKMCQDVCPEDAIRVTDSGVTSDSDRCLLCCACVKACPTGARRMDNPALLEIAQRLSATCGERKPPELFMT